MKTKTKNQGVTFEKIIIIVLILGIVAALAAIVIHRTRSVTPALESKIKITERFLPYDFSELVDIDMYGNYRSVIYINTSGEIMTAIYNLSGKISRKERWTKQEK